MLDPEVVAGLVAAAGPGRPLDRLTDREREVLTLMAEGRSNAAIAARMFVSEKAVGKHTNASSPSSTCRQAHDDNRRVLAVLAWLQGQLRNDDGPRTRGPRAAGARRVRRARLLAQSLLKIASRRSRLV